MQNQSESTATPEPPAIITKYKFPGPSKRMGETVELAFMLKAVTLGFAVARPWGDSERYDFILDSGDRLWRVQVRSTEREFKRGYCIRGYIHVKKEQVALCARDVDAIVAYIVPLDLWYILPMKDFEPRRNIWLYPHDQPDRGRFEKFREAWDLLKPAPCVPLPQPKIVPTILSAWKSRFLRGKPPRSE